MIGLILGSLFGWNGWAFCLFIPLTALSLHLGIRTLYKYFYPKVMENGYVFNKILLKTLYKPFRLFLWFSAATVIISLYAHEWIHVTAIEMVRNLLRIGFIVSFTWVLVILAQEMRIHMHTKRRYDLTMVELFSKLSYMGIFAIALLLILPLLGIQISALLAFGGFTSVIMGLASKDALSNVVGGCIIAVDKPFRIGDWIYSQDGTIDGIVEHIGWRMTKIRTFEKRCLYVPNSKWNETSITNATRMKNRRAQMIIGLGYKDSEKIPHILEDIREYIESSGDFDSGELNYAHFVEFGPSALNIKIRAYTKTVLLKEYNFVLEKFLFKIYDIIQQHGAEIAYPTTHTFFTNNTEIMTSSAPMAPKDPKVVL